MADFKMKPGSKENDTPGGTSTAQTKTNKKLSNSSARGGYGRMGSGKSTNNPSGARISSYGISKGNTKAVKETKTPTNTGKFNNFSRFSGATAPDTSSLYDKGKKFNLPETKKSSTPKAEAPKATPKKSPKEIRQEKRSEIRSSRTSARSEKRAARNTKRIARLEKSKTKQEGKKKLSRNKGSVNQAAKAARISNLESRIAKKRKKTY